MKRFILALLFLVLLVSPGLAEEPQPECVFLAGFVGDLQLVEKNGCFYCKYTPPPGFRFCGKDADWSCAEGLRYGCPCGATLVVYKLSPYGDPEHRCICPDRNQQNSVVTKGGFYLKGQAPHCWFAVGSLDKKHVWLYVQADTTGTVNVDFLPAGAIVRVWRIPDGASAVVGIKAGRQEVFLNQ